jgi:histidyl-tRNA synthetase
MNNARKVSTEPYKGVRDFYPEDMAIQNYIFSIMKKIPESFGYSEYGASVLENSELYRAKSGEEIVNEQTYTFKDKGDRDVSLRPEMTPTVARMIAAKTKEFAMPLRWYSIPNVFRYEKPQKGRLREHWQLNVDIFGVKTIDAEVELLQMASSIMRSFGLKDSNFEIRINNRKIINFILHDLFALNDEDTHKVSKLLDKKEKMDEKEFETGVREALQERTDEFLTIMNSKNFDEFVFGLPKSIQAHEGILEVKELTEKLEKLGITNIVFSQKLMRGFDYYTGLVFEVFDTNPENRRSVFGGGRYDDLLDIFDKEKIPAVGFGMGDVVIKDVLETYGLLPAVKSPADIFVCIANLDSRGYAEDLAQKLREKGLRVVIDVTGKKVGDQIKYADKNKIPNIICIGENEVKTGKFQLKNLSSGVEKEVTEDTVLDVIQK